MVATPQANTESQVLPAARLPWQGESWSRFCNSLMTGRLAHAILLGGPRGTGKRHFANQAAALLLCIQPQNAGSTEAQACGNCKQCSLLAADSHPDLMVLAPVDSRVIKIEQVRRLSDFAVRSPQVARRKVAVIDSADRLNLNAANALLKTLEEPAEDVVLLLLHHAGEPLLPTIRSRCQTQRLPVPPRTQALEWMASADEARAPDELEAALERTRGAPLAALALLQDGLLAAGDECMESLRQFLRGERQLVEAAAPFVRLGLEPSLDLLAHWAFAATKLALGQPDATTGQGREMLGFLARNNPATSFTALLDQLTAVRRQQVYNINPELALNDILLSWKALMPSRRRAVAAR